MASVLWRASSPSLIKAGLGHLWFVTLHPFNDGNGRIVRAIGDLLLARADRSPQRFYSLPAQIQRERKAYYDMLERTQKGTLSDNRRLVASILIAPAAAPTVALADVLPDDRVGAGAASRGTPNSFFGLPLPRRSHDGIALALRLYRRVRDTVYTNIGIASMPSGLAA